MKLGRWSIRHPKSALCAWLVFVASCLSIGAISGTKTLDNGAVGQSARGYALLDRYDLWAPARELAYIHSNYGAVPAGAIVDVKRRFAGAGIAGQPTISADRRSAVVVADARSPRDLSAIRMAVASAAQDYPEITIDETGDISADQARTRTVDRDLRRAELLSIPVTLIVMLFAFGAVTAALVPVLLALSAVAAGLGLLGPLSQVFPVEDSAKTVVLLIGMAVGVDYALFFVVRSRKEQTLGASLDHALETTLATSGRTVLVSGTTVAIAVAGMYIVRVPTLTGIATATIAVIGCAVLAAVTALPATLRLLGPNLERGRLPFLPTGRTESASGFWRAVVGRVMRRPLWSVTLATIFLLAIAYPALSLHVSKPSDLALAAQTDPALRTLANVREAFPAAGESAIITVEAPGRRAAIRDTLRRLTRAAIQDHLASPPTEPIRAATMNGTSAAALYLPLTGNGANATSRHAIDRLRQQLIPASIAQLPGAQTAVTGVVAEDVDFTRQVTRALPYVLGFVLLLAFLVLTVAFRSIVVALKAVVLNLLSVAAAYGVLALVFQHHWAEPILGFHSNGTIVSWLPLFLFVVLFGLSMDYHVFMLSRVREAVDEGIPSDVAVGRSVAETAGVITTAAFVMVAVFALFGSLSSLELKQAGVGLAAAVIIDATVIRAVLLPATMKLLGDWNWYLPRHLRRFPILDRELEA